MSRGILAVSLFVCSLVALNVAAAPATAKPFDISFTPPVSGSSVTVRLAASDCVPVQVRFIIDGEVWRGAIQEVGGSVTFNVPEHTSGKEYTIKFDCGEHSQSEDGSIIWGPN